ncbi:MAG: alpha/beta fold hydrolase, partial [Candidatus Dadabacteria bacterium]|nr:alpha/beta fold hydrolase [Candidatus Dadabacteria bacterium]
IGEDHALDPSEHFIILINQIGSGLSSSPHNTPAPYGMSNFPNVRISDDVRAQHKLITEKFGIEKLALVFGASMGGQQVWEWAVRYPDMVERIAPVAITAKNSSHAFIFADTLNEALKSDPNWNGGNYNKSSDVRVGLFRQARLWAVMGLNPAFYTKEHWKNMGFSTADDFITGFLEAYYEPLDPNDLLCMAWKWQRGDVSRNTGGDLKKALGRIKAKTLIMGFKGDMFVPESDL